MMALYKITRREIQVLEQTFEVDAVKEDEAVHLLTKRWDAETAKKVFPQEARRSIHTEYNVENIL